MEGKWPVVQFLPRGGGSTTALEHPPTIYLREDHLAGGVNEWISRLFSPDNFDETVALLAGAQDGPDPSEAAETRFKQRIEAAESAMAPLQRAMDAGWDPDALTVQYNAAVAEKRAAEAGLNALEPSEWLTADDIREMVIDLGDMRMVLDRAERDDLAELYRALRLAVSYDHRERVADVSISPAPRVDKVPVRGGTHTLTTRLELNL